MVRVIIDCIFVYLLYSEFASTLCINLDVFKQWVAEAWQLHQTKEV